MKLIKIRVYGIVQGVGFRPFVSRLATACGLRGSVCNKGSYVEILVQGDATALIQFQKDLKALAPERSVILKIDVTEQPPEHFDDFQIIESKKRSGDIFVSPDIAICPTCKTELFDKNNRRYLHPFINCTACGPRLTILKQMPYDRARTTMSGFPMCAQCAAEYETSGDRRYDAQPVCCHDCGPQVYLIEDQKVQGEEAIRRARTVIREGGIVAVKGIGGFHLCCDAGNETAVKLLRERKSRPQKPFAVMAKDLDTAQRICEIDATQAELLDSPQKPILICKKRLPRDTNKEPEGELVTEAVAPDNPTLGVMLPYAPLQLLLFDDPLDDCKEQFPKVLVMTSGNRGGAPICRNDAEVVEQLAGLCDCMLSNDRAILIRADDSVLEASAGEAYMVRRSRGYAPLPTAVSVDWQGQVLAVGGELKNTFCIGKDSFFYPSPYVGDLSDLRCEQALDETVSRMLELFETKPAVVACDLHPDYRSAAYAKTLGLPVIPVQHHYAHVLSCMAEHDALAERVIGVVFDGTGYGPDGTVWGGELLLADVNGSVRAGSLRPFTQTGGDAAAREGWRIAVSLILEKYGNAQAKPLAERLGLCEAGAVEMLAAMQRTGFQCVTSTSAGRLFDAVSALLGIRQASTFEGEAAMALQYAAEAYLMERERACASAEQETGIQIVRSASDAALTLDYEPLLEQIISGRLEGVPVNELAYRFHVALADGVADGCAELGRQYGLHTVALSGGCFCNRLLLRLTEERLQKTGLRVLTHRKIPANDGGIALGQAVYAMNRLNRDGR